MTLREAIEAVHAKHGKLTPELLVEEARGNRSTAGKFLHSRFDWDDREAAESWRREQASKLIRVVRQTYREATEDEAARSVRVFHSVRRPDGYSYEPLDAVAEDPLTLAMVLRDAEREWKTLHRRYSHLVEWAQIVRRDLEDDAA